MRDNLPNKIQMRECGIVNLDSKQNEGFLHHWVSYIKNKNKVLYFDSYGNLKPPIELVKYFKNHGKIKIYNNYDVKQKNNTYNCGQLSIEFLYINMLNENFNRVQ